MSAFWVILKPQNLNARNFCQISTAFPFITLISRKQYNKLTFLRVRLEMIGKMQRILVIQKKVMERAENKGLLNTDLPRSQSVCKILQLNTLFLLVSSTWFKVRPHHLTERYFSWGICTYLFIYWVWVCIYTHLAVGLVSVGLTERGC